MSEMYMLKLPDKISTALLVLAGYYGVGEERKNKLESLGYNYREIQNCVNELIKTKLGIKEDLVSIPTEDNGTKDTDLSLYSGNLLRENFRFHAETKCSLTEDELCYLLGNDRATTMLAKAIVPR